MTVRIGVDTGGTHTDLVLIDDAGAALLTLKVPSTLGDLSEGILDGLKLIGFTVWERRTGNGRNVTFPARQYTVGGERRTFALLRPITGDPAAQERLRELILQAYAEYEEKAAVAS